MQDYLIVLVNGAGALPLTRALVLDVYGMIPAEFRTRFGWLDPGEAAELGFSVGSPAEAKVIASFIGEELVKHRVDCALVPAQGRRKKLLIADMESTMIGEECLDELAIVAGIGPQIAAITERAMRGELDFEAALRERVGLLKGLPVAELDKLRDRLTLLPGGSKLVATMRAHGAYTALVSGGFSFFTEPVARSLGFDVHFANRLGITAGKLDGTVAEPILGRAAKADRLAALASEHGLALSQTLAVGDGANDVAMIQAAGLGVAYRGKPLLAAVASANIRHADLTALLYFQGYRRGDFAA